MLNSLLCEMMNASQLVSTELCWEGEGRGGGDGVALRGELFESFVEIGHHRRHIRISISISISISTSISSTGTSTICRRRLLRRNSFAPTFTLRCQRACAASSQSLNGFSV